MRVSNRIEKIDAAKIENETDISNNIVGIPAENIKNMTTL